MVLMIGTGDYLRCGCAAFQFVGCSLWFLFYFMTRRGASDGVIGHGCIQLGRLLVVDVVLLVRRWILIVVYGQATRHAINGAPKGTRGRLWRLCSRYYHYINDHSYHAFEVTKTKLFPRRHTNQWQFNMAHQNISAQQNEFTIQTKILAKIWTT